MSYPQRPPTLVMRQGPRPNQAFPLHKTLLTLGRAVDNDIAVDDAEVSRHHARLTLRGNNWILEDLGSRNGTFVNGQRITGPVILTPGSKVALGPDILFSMEGGAPVAPVARRPAARRGGPRWPLLAGLAVLVVAVLAGAAVLAYFCLNPPTEPSVIAELPTVPGPDIAFQEPAPGTRVGQGSSVLVFATARDENKVTLVDLWVDDQLVAQQASPDTNGITPLSLIHNWVAATPGTYALMVRAYNSLGATGESPVLHVTVSEEPEPATAQYVAKPGDTPATVAKVMSTTVTAIQGENPTIGSGLTPGQIIIVPIVVIVPSPPQQGQAAGGQAAGGQAPAGGPQPVVGGAAPAGPKAGGPAAGGAGGPKAGGVVVGKAAGPLTAPSLQDVKAKDCSVTLTWKDNSDNEVGFLVYRGVSGAPGYKLLSSEKARNGTGSQVQYVDQVPRPDTYLYYVEAVNAGGRTASSLRKATVFPTAACIQPAGYHQVVFRPLKVDTPNYKQAALYFSIANAIGRRIPLKQQTYLPTKDPWNKYKQALPAPAPIYLNPNDPILLTVGSAGSPGSKDLGAFFRSLPRNELGPQKTWTDKGKGKGGEFTLDYNLWLENVTWGQGVNAQKIPRPTDLQFAPDATTLKKKLPVCPGCDPSRTLIWDWTGNQKEIEGYILYRFYSCPGKDAQIMAPEVIPNPAQQGKMIPAWTVPSGCAARYQVSAYGPAGESKPSDSLDVSAGAPIARVKVTFKTLSINKNPGQGATGKLALQANHYLFESDPFTLKPGPSSLGKYSTVVNLSEGDSLQLGFAVASAGGVLCKSQNFFKPPPNNDWTQHAGTHTLPQKGGDCQVTVEIGKEAVLPAGQAARPQADVGPSAVGFGVIGKDIYLFLENLGPDPLTANKVKLESYWIDPNTQKHVSEQKLERSVSIGVGDNQVLKVGTIPSGFDPKNPSRFGLKITPLDFDDPNLKNNTLEKEPQSVSADPPPPPTPPQIATPQQQTKEAPKAQGGGTVATFKNNTAHPIVYLSIDGGQSVIGAGLGILPNKSYEVATTPGKQHTFLAMNGFWEGNTRNDFYRWDWKIQQGETFTFNNPSIAELLAPSKKSLYWEGEFWTGFPVTPHTAGFCFYPNGKFTFYVDGQKNDTGDYTLTKYDDTLIVKFKATGDGPPKETFDGWYYETKGFFQMKNGPADWNLIEYYSYPNVACP